MLLSAAVRFGWRRILAVERSASGYWRNSDCATWCTTGSCISRICEFRCRRRARSICLRGRRCGPWGCGSVRDPQRKPCFSAKSLLGCGRCRRGLPVLYRNSVWMAGSASHRPGAGPAAGQMADWPAASGQPDRFRGCCSTGFGSTCCAWWRLNRFSLSARRRCVFLCAHLFFVFVGLALALRRFQRGRSRSVARTAGDRASGRHLYGADSGGGGRGAQEACEAGPGNQQKAKREAPDAWSCSAFRCPASADPRPHTPVFCAFGEGPTASHPQSTGRISCHDCLVQASFARRHFFRAIPFAAARAKFIKRLQSVCLAALVC